MLCTRVCMCACVCVRACEYDEPFSYLISSYSSSRIVLLVIARTARCFRFRCTVTFELSVYLSSLLRVDDAAGGTWRRSSKPKRNERTSKESQEKNESIAFSPLLFFFSLIFSYSSFFPTIFRGQDITFSFGEEQKRPRITKGKAIRARSKDSKSKPTTGL